MHPRVLHKGVCAVLLRNTNNSRAQTVSAWGGGGGRGLSDVVVMNCP